MSKANRPLPEVQTNDGMRDIRSRILRFKGLDARIDTEPNTGVPILDIEFKTDYDPDLYRQLSMLLDTVGLTDDQVASIQNKIDNYSIMNILMMHLDK